MLTVQEQPTSAPAAPPWRRSAGKRQKPASPQEAERVHVDDDEDFETAQPLRRACASQVWKIQPVKYAFATGADPGEPEIFGFRRNAKDHCATVAGTCLQH